MATGTSSGKVHDRMQLLLATTSDRRVRLQGLQDASLHFGWVHSFEQGVLTVNVSSKRGINVGDFMYLEVSAQKSLLTFIAYVTVSMAHIIKLQISSEVDEKKLKSESRLKVKSFGAELTCPTGCQCAVEVVNVSENGFGFQSPTAVKISGECTILLKSAFGDINLTGDVRHSRKEGDESQYQGGVLIKDMDRVSKARWVQLVGG